MGGLAGGVQGPGPPRQAARQEETGEENEAREEGEGGYKGEGQEARGERLGEDQGSEGVLGWARRYHHFTQSNPAYSDQAREEFSAICLGLCRAAGSVVRAAQVLRVGHPGRAGPHLSPEAVEQALAGRMDGGRLQLLVQTLSKGACVRVKDSGYEHRKGIQWPPHQSARDHEEELWGLVWKDAVRGGAMILPREGSEDLLSEVEFSPLGRVDKRDHLGRIKPVGRLIHDISYGGEDSVNARTDQESVPTMVLPTVENVVRSTLYWKARYPDVKVVITKRDIDSAFRRIPLEPGGGLNTLQLCSEPGL